MRRGELWRYTVPRMAGRTVALVTAQAVLDQSGYKTFPALEVTDTDPGHLLATTTVIDGAQVWIDAVGGWQLIRRSLLTECLARLPDDALATLDRRVAAALGHPDW